MTHLKDLLSSEAPSFFLILGDGEMCVHGTAFLFLRVLPIRITELD